MEPSNSRRYVSSVYSDDSSQYAPALAEYSSVNGAQYTSTTSTHYDTSNIAATAGQATLSSQYLHQRGDAPTTSTPYGTTSTAATPGYTTLTSQELRRHDARLHSDQRHTRSAHRSHRRRSGAASQVTHSNAGMAPSEYPQQLHSGNPQVNTTHYQTTSPHPQYQSSPSTTHSSSSTPHNNESYSHTQYTPPSSVSSTGYNNPQDTTYWTQYTQSPTQGKDLTDWGYDLAGVGTQFHGNDSQQTYASYSNDQEQ